MAAILGKITVIKRNGSSGSQYPVTSTSCLFGKDAECEIRIQLPTISGQECKLEFDENGNFILSRINDEGELFLNDESVQTCATVYHNDVLKIAGRSFRLEYPPNLEKMRILSLGARATPKSRLIEKLKQTERRRVSFGPQLSPEQFVATLPPNTPVRKGAIPKMQSLEGDTPIPKRKSICRRSARLSPKTPLQDLNASAKKLTPVNSNKDLKQQALISFDSPVVQPMHSTLPLEKKTPRRSRNSFSVQKTDNTPKPTPQPSAGESPEAVPENLIDFDTVVDKHEGSAIQSAGEDEDGTGQNIDKQDGLDHAAEKLQLGHSEQDKEELQLSLFPPKRTYRRSKGSVGELEASVQASSSPPFEQDGNSVLEPQYKSVLDTSHTEFDEVETSPSEAQCANVADPKKDPLFVNADNLETVNDEPGSHMEICTKPTPAHRRRSSRLSANLIPPQALSHDADNNRSKSAYELVNWSPDTPEQVHSHEIVREGSAKKTSTPLPQKKTSRRSRKSFKKMESDELLKNPEPSHEEYPQEVNVEEKQKAEVSLVSEKKINMDVADDSTADSDEKQVTKSTSRKRSRSGQNSFPVLDREDVSPSVNEPSQEIQTKEIKRITSSSTPISQGTVQEIGNSEVDGLKTARSNESAPSPAMTDTTEGTKNSVELDLGLDRFASPSGADITTEREKPTEFRDAPSSSSKKMTPAAVRRRSIRSTRLSLAQQLSPNLSPTVQRTPSNQKERIPSRRSARRSRSYGATRKTLPLWSEIVKKSSLKQPVLKQISKTKNVKETNKQKLLAYSYMTPEQRRALRHVDSPATIYIGRAERKRRMTDAETYSPYECPAKENQSFDWEEIESEPPGINLVLKTPKQKAESVEEHFGTKRLFKTPRVGKNEEVEGISEIKQLVKTPKERKNSATVQDHLGLKRLLKTPKEKKKSAEVTKHFGTKRLLKTPKNKKVACEVENNLGLKRLLKTPKQAKSKEVTENFGTRRLLKTPKERKRNEAVKEHFGMKRLLKTPKEKNKSNKEVTEHFGTKRLLKTPKEKVVNEPVGENLGIKRLMKTPRASEKYQEVVEHFGLNRLMHTPREKLEMELMGDFGTEQLFQTPVSEETIVNPTIEEICSTEVAGVEKEEEEKVREGRKSDTSESSQKISAKTRSSRSSTKVGEIDTGTKKTTANKSVTGKRVRYTRSKKQTEEETEKEESAVQQKEKKQKPTRASRTRSTRQTQKMDLMHVPASEENGDVEAKVPTKARVTRSAQSKRGVIEESNLAAIDEDNVMTFQDIKKTTGPSRARSTRTSARQKKLLLPAVREEANEDMKDDKEVELKPGGELLKTMKRATDASQASSSPEEVVSQKKQRTTRSKAQKPAAGDKIDLDDKEVELKAEEPVKTTCSSRSLSAKCAPHSKKATAESQVSSNPEEAVNQKKQRTTRSKAQKPAAGDKLDLEDKNEVARQRRSTSKRGVEAESDGDSRKGGNAPNKKMKPEEPRPVRTRKAPATVVSTDKTSTRKSSRIATRGKK